MIAATFLLLLGGYLAAGLAFALVFSWRGVRRIDPHAAQASRGFRLLVIPGAAALWPLLWCRWMRGSNAPPEEVTAHRQRQLLSR